MFRFFLLQMFWLRCVYALQYEANKMRIEALKTYDSIVNCKEYLNNGKLQINMANLYFQMGNYDKAIRLYKMALDKVN